MAHIPITEVMLSERHQSRFNEKVEVNEEGCHIWVGGRCPLGYGRFKVEGTTVLAHRYSVARTGEALHVGKVLDHLCRVPSCVNPAHLEQISQEENTARGTNPMAPGIALRLNEGRCKAGHLLTPDNWRHSGGRFRCMPCKRADDAAHGQLPGVKARRAEKARARRAREKDRAAQGFA